MPFFPVFAHPAVFWRVVSFCRRCIGAVLPDIPEFATLILVVLGIVLALVPLKKNWEEWIRARPRLIRIVLAVCVSIGGVGFFVSRYQGRKTDAAMKHLYENSDQTFRDTQAVQADMKHLYEKADQTLQNTQAVLSASAVLGQAQSNFSEKLNQFRTEEAARSPQLLAAVKDAAQFQNVAYKHFLVTTARSTGKGIHDLGYQWYEEDDKVLTLHSPDSNRDQMRTDVARHYFALVRTPLESADSLRQALLQLLPSGSRRPEDQIAEARIRKILTGELYPRESEDVKEVGTYLYALANRIEPE